MNFFSPPPHYPCQELPEKGKRRIGDNEVSLIAQRSNFLAAEVAVAVQILPFKVVYIDAPIAAFVFLQYEYLAFDGSFGTVKLRSVLLEQRWLIWCFVFLAIRRIARGNQFFQSKFIELGGKVACEVAPFGVVARQQNSLPPEYVRVIFKVCVHLNFYVVELSIELIVFSRLGFFQITVGHTSCRRSLGLSFNPIRPRRRGISISE